MTRAQRLEKFWLCWNLADPGPGEARGQTLIERIDGLENLAAAGELIDLLRI